MKTEPNCCNHDIPHKQPASHDHSHEEHEHDHGPAGGWRSHRDLLLGLLILLVMLTLEFAWDIIPRPPFSLLIYLAAYLLSGWNVLYMAWRKLLRADIFNEFFLMSVATIGAFLIGEYSEGVAVMVFYAIGEWFQEAAVNRARQSIKALLDVRPDKATVIRNGERMQVNPSAIAIGEIIEVKPGEKVALDGELFSGTASFNTAALTGESRPDTKSTGDQVYAGMVNLNTAAQIRVKALYTDSKLSRILEMVQDATARKSQTQLFISRFARVYTPIVFFLALALVLLPWFFVSDYVFRDWLYRGLVFLVISCPCALVVSIPLGYFGGIGLASRNGILFKGGNFLDVMTRVNAVVMDKTGTLTKGVFRVQEVVAAGMTDDELLRLAAAVEVHSTHPVAKAVAEHAKNDTGGLNADHVEEIAGHGLKAQVDGKEVLAGNLKLMKKFGVAYPAELENIVDTIVVLALGGSYAGYITIADEVKEDAAQAVADMHRLGLKTVMLSGDKQSVVDNVARRLNIDMAFGDLLPEDKVRRVEELKAQRYRIAFVGDGVNDAPVIALADAGIAMGGLGSDAAIETADVVIQNDQPMRIVSAIRIGKITRNIVWQNIVLAMAVKGIVLALGAGGIATLWEAVIADVGVALLAILNAVRIQHKRLD